MGFKPLSLREAALRLGKIPSMKTGGKIADGHLLGLLKDGVLGARIQVPQVQASLVPVPAEYWMAVSSEKFRIIRRTEGQGGSYRISLSAVAESYLQVLTDSLRSGDRQLEADVILREMQVALRIADRKFEAIVDDDEFCKYLGREGFVENPFRRENRGAKEKPSWRHIAPILGAYFLSKQYIEGQTQEAIALAVLAVAEKAEVSKPPDYKSLLPVISEVFKAISEFEN